MILKKRHLLLLFMGGLFHAQIGGVGINTSNPLQTFHIDGAKDNPATGLPSSTQEANDVVITSDGKLGVGLINPVTKLDLRSTDNRDNSLGVGQTTQSASNVGAGAIRYSPLNGGNIQFSDGIIWYILQSNTTKTSIVEKIKDVTSLPPDTPVLINTWTEFADTTNSFTNGIFTSPRTANYLIAATYDIWGPGSSNINNSVNPPNSNAYAEIRFVNPSNNNIYAKCVKSFGEISANQMQVGGYCISGVSLAKGDQLVVQIYQHINGQILTLRNDNSSSTFGFNNLTINEQ